MRSYTIEQINAIIDGKVHGETTQTISGLEHIQKAKPHQATFIGNRKYAGMWADSKATLAIANDNLDITPGINRVIIKVKNADLAMAKLLEAFTPQSPHFCQYNSLHQLCNPLPIVQKDQLLPKYE